MRVRIREILADPVKRRDLMIRALYSTQLMEDPTMTMERAERAYDKVQEERRAMSHQPVRCFMGNRYCTDHGKVVALAPQEAGPKSHQSFTFRARRFIYLPVCEFHLDGWWEGSDVRPESRPPTILPVTDEGGHL